MVGNTSKVVWLNCESIFTIKSFKKHFRDIHEGCGEMVLSMYTCFHIMLCMMDKDDYQSYLHNKQGVGLALCSAGQTNTWSHCTALASCLMFSYGIYKFKSCLSFVCHILPIQQLPNTFSTRAKRRALARIEKRPVHKI